MDSSISLNLELAEVANMFPTIRQRRGGHNHLSILKTVFGAVVYANWIAFTQSEYDNKRHSVDSVTRLMKGMIGSQIRNEFATALAVNNLSRFKSKWLGTPGLARVIGTSLSVHLLDPG